MKLSEDGAAVMLAARNAELLKELRAEIETKGGRAAWLSLDLRQPEAPALLVEKTIEVLGGIDIVVNNARATKRGDFAAKIRLLVAHVHYTHIQPSSSLSDLAPRFCG